MEAGQWAGLENGHGNLHHPEGMELLIIYYRVKLSAPLGNYLNEEFKVTT